MNFEYPRPATESIFENGFVALHYSSAAYSTVSLRLCVLTGSVDEDEFVGCGISHFVEHSVFNGAGGLDKSQMAEAFATIGAFINAYTFFDRTVYCIDVPTKNVDIAMKMLADMVFRPAFDKDSFALEKDVILREIDMCADDLDDYIMTASNRKTYTTHPLRFPIIGERLGFESPGLEDIRRYHSRRYVPQNMFLACASNMSDKDFNKLAKKYFGNEKFGRFEVAKHNVEYPQIAPRSVECYKDCATARQTFTYRITNLDSRSLAALDAFSFVLTSGNSGKLVREFKYKRNIVDSLGSEILVVGEECLFSFYCECNPKNAQVVKEEFLLALEKFATQPISSEDRKKYIVNCMLSISNAQRTAAAMSEYILNMRFPGVDVPMCKDYIKLFETLSDTEITNICRNAIDVNKLTYAQLSPKSSAQKRSSKASSKSEEISLDKLSNGLRLLFVPVKDSTKTYFSVNSQGGPQSCKGIHRSLQGLASLLILRDTKKRDAATLAEFVESNGLSFTSSFNENFSTIISESLHFDWRKSLEIIGDAVCRLNVNKSTFETERRSIISEINETMEDPYSAGFLELRKAFFSPQNPLYYSPDGDIEVLNKATFADLQKTLSKTFTADSSILCVSGKFDAQAIKDACEVAFADMKKGAPEICMNKKLSSANLCGTKTINLNKAQSLVFAAMQAPSFLNKDVSFPASILTEILGGENGVVFERVREREGLAYSAGVGYLCNFSNGMFYFNASSLKKNLARIEDIYMAIIEEYSSGKIDEKRFSAAKDSFKSRLSMQLEDIAARAGFAVNGMFMEGSPQTLKTLLEKTDKVDISDVADFAAKILKNPLIFKVI